MCDAGTQPDLGGASRGGGTVDGSLYERLGGVDAITAVFRAVVDRQMTDDRIDQEFARTTVDRLRQKA